MKALRTRADLIPMKAERGGGLSGKSLIPLYSSAKILASSMGSLLAKVAQ